MPAGSACLGRIAAIDLLLGPRKNVGKVLTACPRDETALGTAAELLGFASVHADLTASAVAKAGLCHWDAFHSPAPGRW